MTCTFCKKAHPSVNCNIVSNCAARKEILKREGRCFVCLKKSHLARQCTSNIRCFRCKKRHHASVCEQPPESIQTAEARNLSTNSAQSLIQSQTQTNPVRRDIGQSTTTPTTATMLIDVKNAVLLQTAKGYISAASSPDKTVVSRMIFDSGSQKTYISERLRGALGLPTISREALSIKVFGTDVGTPKLYDVTQFCVRSPYSDENLYVTAHVISTVCAPLKHQVIQQAIKHQPPLASLPLADWPENKAQDSEVDILIGSDFYWHFMTGRCIRGEYGPAALETKLGWVLSGPVPWDQEAQCTQTNLTLTHLLMVNEGQSKEDEPTKESLENQLSKFWDLENLGILKSEDTVYQNFEEEIKFVDGRYEVKLPWKEQHPLLPDNFKLSQKRLQSLGRRLKSDPEILQAYDEVIQDQLEKGIIERVSPNEESPVGKTCYIPHQAVIKKDRDTTKLRVVYDASAKTRDEPSLNNCLYPGPCLLHNVVEILARFRFHSTALVADIEKAFLMIAIHPDDRNALRFLWYENIEEEDPDIIIYRFCRVIFGVNCSPFLLNATLHHHVNQYMESHGEVCKEILRSLYVDDLNTGAQSDEECMQIYNVARKVMLDGAFNLRKWRTNSKSLQREIDAKESAISPQSDSNEADQEVEESYAKATVGNKPESNSQEQKVLGLLWNYEEDDLIFRLSKVAEEGTSQPPTKRTVLRTIAKVFDPLGLITPVTTPMKVLFQDICNSKTDWDETLQPELQETWEKWLKSCEKAGEIKVPRHYFGEKKEKAKEIELHGFCDSSQTSYAAAVYAKYESEGTTKVSLVMSKTRVAPISKLSIPRLELMSCLILSRLMENVKEALQPIVKIRSTHYWSDSVTALYWIKGTDKDWSVFVDNRAQEIRRLSSPKQWKHCPGKENPADLPTRGTTPLKLNEKSSWWSGPNWLSQEKEMWPTSPIPPVSQDADLELRQRKETSVNEQIVAMSSAEEESSIQKVIPAENFSNLTRLLRVTSYVLRFIRNCREKGLRKFGQLTAEEYKDAESMWIKDCQQEFREKNNPQLQYQLGTFTDESGILRCRGRLANADLPYESKFPALLPREKHLTHLIIRDCHTRVMHNGVKETLLELRTRFWVIKGRQAMKKILTTCVTCKRIQGKSYGNAATADLPAYRVQEIKAFSVVGVDFAGPLYVKKDNKDMRKIYIALFTCATSRAIHLELVDNLDTETFLRCFRRFSARRGLPSKLVSDNAKTFKSAAKKLVALFELPGVISYLVERQIKWSFNLAKASWMGGFFERLVRSVKSSLKKVIGHAKLSLDELNTVIVEIEATLNSRPLTYIYPEVGEEALTPSHLMLGKRLLTLPLDSVEEEDDPDYHSKEALAGRAKHLSNVLNHFHSRWRKEYLTEVREHHRMTSGKNHHDLIAKGDIVTIQDENRKNRTTWKLGKVESLIIGREEIVRGANVRTANGKIISRPIQKLYPLEVKSELTEEIKNRDQTREENAEADNYEEHSPRTKRKAAILADEKRRIIDQFT